MIVIAAFLLWAIFFIALNAYCIMRVIKRYQQGTLFNTRSKKITFLPAVIHYIAFITFGLLLRYVATMSLYTWSEHPWVKKLVFFWQFGWYWFFIAPVVWFAFLGQDTIIKILQKKPDIKRPRFDLLCKTILISVGFFVVIIIISLTASFFSEIAGQLFNWLYYIILSL